MSPGYLSVTPFCFQDFGSFLLSLFWILFQVHSLSPLLFALVDIYHVPLPDEYFSAFAFCLDCCIWGDLSVGWKYVSEWVISLSRVQLFVTPWTEAHQAPLSVEFSRQECWSGLPFPSPGDLPSPGIEPGSSALQADSLLIELQGKHTQSKFWTVPDGDQTPSFLD